MPLNTVHQNLLNALVEQYGTWEKYQASIALLPAEIQQGLTGDWEPHRNALAELKSLLNSGMSEQRAYTGISEWARQVLSGEQRGAFAISPEVIAMFKRDYSEQATEELLAKDSLPPVLVPLPAEKETFTQVVSLGDKGRLKAIREGEVYIGRAMPAYRLSASPLANPHAATAKTAASHEEAASAFTQGLVLVLRAQIGPMWDEVKRLALLRRSGKELALACWCRSEANPLPCHGEPLAFAIDAFARRTTVGVVIEELERRWVLKSFGSFDESAEQGDFFLSA